MLRLNRRKHSNREVIKVTTHLLAGKPAPRDLLVDIDQHQILTWRSSRLGASIIQTR
jgi:hypothetical protein